METTVSPLGICCDPSVVSLLSVPDLESLEEIADDDVQELLQLVSSAAVGGRDTNTAAAASSGCVEADARSGSASRSFRGHVELPKPFPSQVAPSGSSSNTSSNSISGGNHSGSAGAGTTLLPHSLARWDPTRSSPITAEFVGGAPPTFATSTLAPSRQTRTAAMSAGGVGAGSFSSSAAAGPPPLLHVSDTAVLDAEQRRWGSQLVQECWMHQELHNIRWNEQRLLKHGAAYRPRAIASRTAMKMTHTKSLCIALNVDVTIIENASEAQVAEDVEEGSLESARLPSLSSPEAEAWSPLLVWRSPALTPGDAPTVLTQLSECLREQYEGLAPRPLSTSCCANARPSDLVQTLSDARKDAGEAKVIFHYLARGVPPPRGGNLYLTNTTANVSGYAGPLYSKLSLDTFRSRVGFPLVFIADCAEAREILNYYIRMCEEQHQQRYFTSSREYQLKSSLQVSAAELDSLVDGQMGAGTGSFDRVGSGADLSSGDNLRRSCGLGGMEGTPPTQSAVLQDFYFIGATGSSTMGGGGGGAGGTGTALRGKSISGGGVYDDFGMSSNSLARAGLVGGNAGGGAAVCNGDAGALRHHVRLPSDILTSCLTTPLRMAILWFIAERPELHELHPLLLRLFPGALNDKKTPLGQLQWYLQSIVECIAWSTLSLPEYSRLFREDIYVAPLFRGYILAERIIVGGLGGCLSVYPPVAATHSHALWSTWDNLVERACVSVLRAVHPAPPRCASVLEFRSWLDEQVTSWKYTRPDLLAVTTTTATNITHITSCLPSTPDEAAVIMPSLLTESLRGMQAQLDGITQQSFERPRVFFAEIVGLHPPASPPVSTMWGSPRGPGEDGGGEKGEGGRRSRRQTSTLRLSGRGDAAGARSPQPGLLPLRDVADRYANPLRSSYSTQQQHWEGGAFTPDGSHSGAVLSTAVSAVTVSDLLSGGGGVKAEKSRHTSPRAARTAGRQQPHQQQQNAVEDGAAMTSKGRGMPNRADSRTALPTGRYQRTSQANLVGLAGSTSPAVAAGGEGGGATAATSNPAVAAVARKDARRSLSRLSGRKAEYVPNLYTNSTTSGQATSFQYTAGLNPSKRSSELFMESPASPPALTVAAASPLQQHTFPFIDRMPLLLQALLVAAHREKATELVCRLVDCGPAAVLQCAEANIYRFVLDRYWNRPDLRFLMPATLFIYCKSCYADPELIGTAKQRDIAVKACAEVLQSPVAVPPLASTGSATVEEEPGAWQNATLGPYSTPYGQRMLASALLTLIALHSDDGREACHRYGVFQLCCQLLQRVREEAPLLLMRTLETAAAGSPSPPSSMPPLPRPPSSTAGSSFSFSSPLQAHSHAANAAAEATPAMEAAAAAAAEELPPPPSIAITYYVTLLTLFVSLLCNWKPAGPSPESDDDGDEESGGVDAGCGELSPPLDGTVHELPPTTVRVLAAGLHAASPALLNFTYSDTSILRGAALRCFMMVLISPAPSVLSRNSYVEVVLRFIEGETFHRCELNTDLRLEEMGMAYTTFRWLLDQLREDLPIEEIGQYVAVWVYKWFWLSAQGKTVTSPLPSSALQNVHEGGAAQGSPKPQQCQQALPASCYSSGAQPQRVPPTSVSYRGSSVVTPGSVYSHRGSNVLVPAARSLYGGAMHDAAGDGVTGSLVNAMASGLRQHLTQQDHRRVQACLPPLSNIVRLCLEHTQDACPYIRTYARKVVREEFGFLHQSWYDDYAGRDLHVSPGEEDYGGGVSGHHRGYHHQHHSSQQRRRSYGTRQNRMHEGRPSGDAAPTASGVHTSADPVTASSMDGGGDLSTYLPLREMLCAGKVFDDTLNCGAAGAGNSAALQLGHSRSTGSIVHPGDGTYMQMADPHAASAAAAARGPASAPALMAFDIDDVPDPQPAALRRFIGRLLRIASTDGREVAGSLSSFPRGSSRQRLEDDGMMRDDEGGGPAADGVDARSGEFFCGRRGSYSRPGSDGEGEGSYHTERYGQERHGIRRRGDGGGNAARHRGVGGERGTREDEGYYLYNVDDAADGSSDMSVNGTLLDSETLALHPLWAMDSTSMTNFAYGALSFLERFMLEKMDDGDPRHPMNLEKENALHHYFQRVERNLRAFAQDEAPDAEAVDSGTGTRRSHLASVVPAAASRGEVNDATAGSRLLNGSGSSSAAAPTCAPFHCLGVGDIGRAGIPGYSQRCSGLRSRDREPSFSYPFRGGGRSSEGAAVVPEGSPRVAGSVDVVLLHPSEPLVITSTTGGLLSVWSYDHLGLPTNGGDEETEHAHGSDGDEENNDSSSSSSNDGGGDGAGRGDTDGDGEAAQPPHSRQRSAVLSGSRAVAPLRRLHAKAQFFLRDVVGRSRSDLSYVARPRFMYDRFNPNTEAPRPRDGNAGQWRSQRGYADSRRGTRGRDFGRYPGCLYRPDEMMGGGRGSRAVAWMDRAEAANAMAALPSSYQHGFPHFYHGVGDLHLVDAAHHPLICAVRRFGAVEVFSHFSDRHRVRRVTTFETARFDQTDGLDQCVSSYQSCTGLLYVSNGEGEVSAWDLGNEQRMATLGTLVGTDSVATVGAGNVSALKAHPYTPYEYIVGSYGKQVCLFDLRDSSSSNAARLGYAHPSSSFTFTSSSPTNRNDTGSDSSSSSPLSSLCVRVCYSHRYPDAVVAGYACGTVAVWDRRYPKQPSLLYGAALSGVAEGRGGGGRAKFSERSGALTVIRQLDVHPCSKHFLTLTTTPTSLQLLQPRYRGGGGANAAAAGAALSGGVEEQSESGLCGSRAASLYQRNLSPACEMQSYNLVSGKGEGNGEVSNCELSAACFHEFSPVLCVGTGGCVRLYGTSHLSTMATYMDVDGA